MLERLKIERVYKEMTEFKVNISEDLNKMIQEPKEQMIQILIVLELYREEKLTIRQAASILKVSYRDFLDIMAQHKTYLNYGLEEALEDLEFAESSRL